MAQGGHHRTQSGGGLPSSLTGVNAGYLGMGGMGGMGGIHAAQAYGMATPRLMQASTSVRADSVFATRCSHSLRVDWSARE